MRNSKNQLIRSLGYPDPHPDDQLYSALMLQPRIVGGLTVIGVLLQTPWLFLALSAALWWSALVPTRSLFDAIYNYGVARPRAVGGRASPSSFRRRTGWGCRARDWRCTPGGSQEHSLGARSPADSCSGGRRLRTILRRSGSLPCPAATLVRRRAHRCGAAPLRIDVRNAVLLGHSWVTMMFTLANWARWAAACRVVRTMIPSCTRCRLEARG